MIFFTYLKSLMVMRSEFSFSFNKAIKRLSAQLSLKSKADYASPFVCDTKVNGDEVVLCFVPGPIEKPEVRLAHWVLDVRRWTFTVGCFLPSHPSTEN